MDKSLFADTPSVTVSDSRGLTLRTIAYHRHPDARRVVKTLIYRHAFDARGFLAHSADPRLHAVGRVNVRYNTAPAGSKVRTQAADSGTAVALNDAAGRLFLAVSSIRIADNDTQDGRQAVTRTWQYEDQALPGRLVSVTERITGEAARVAERFVYAGTTDAQKALNLAGQCVCHYDTAGMLQTVNAALTGVPLSVIRRLLRDADYPDVHADWQGENARGWDDLLDREPYTTLTAADTTGAALTATDAKGNQQRAGYDVAGRLSGSWLTLKGGSEQVIVKSLMYSAAGQKLCEVHGNGLVTTYTYEAETQRLTGITTKRPAGHAAGKAVLRDLRYEFDAVGNVLTITSDAEETRFWRNQKVVPQNTYTYDSLYQLVRATGREMAGAGQHGSSPSAMAPTPTDGSAYTNYTRTYSYDSAGNLTQICHSPAAGSGYTVSITVSDRSNRGVLSTLTDNSAEVDALFLAGGQQKQLQPGQSLVWTVRNELMKVTPVVRDSDASDSESYRYDGGNQRIFKVSRQTTGRSVQTQRVLYLPCLELRTKTSGSTQDEELQVITAGEAGRVQVRVLHWVSGRPADVSNNLMRYSYDSLTCSSGLEADGDGNIISTEEYYPYGGTAVWIARHAAEADYKTIRYSGKERDATALYYYGYRYYQPWAGRWLSADPAGTVDGLNLFRMCRNNPVSYIDADGKIPTNVSSAYDHMATEGNVWEYKHGISTGFEHITSISNKNIESLSETKMTHDEKNFMENFMSLNFHITHFTDKDFRGDNGDLNIYSRKQLQRKKIKFNSGNTELLDLNSFATDDFVFFGLEAGSELSKKKSRFGNVAYRVRLSSLPTTTLSYSHAQIVDLGNYDVRPVRTPPAWLAPQDKEKFFNGNITRKKVTDFVFVGKDMLKGIGMTIVNDLREFSSETRGKVLNMRSESEINGVMNSMLRPQIAVPNSLSLKKGQFNVSFLESPNSSRPLLSSKTLANGQTHFYI